MTTATLTTPGKRLTPEKTAELLGRCVESVMRLIEAGELRAVNVGNGKTKPRWIITEADIADFERRRQNAPPPKSTKRQKQPATPAYYPE